MMFRRLSQALIGTVALVAPTSALSLLTPQESAGTLMRTMSEQSSSTSSVVYKSLSVPVEDFGVTVPVACWFQAPMGAGAEAASPATRVRYEHRISVKRIGQLLAGWNFIPSFASREFFLSPGPSVTIDGQSIDLPTSANVVLLCHGYLGSRFDLSHLAEKLAAKGFLCLAAEYPESLAASFDRVDGLTRSIINDKLLERLKGVWNVQARAFGIIGHSLGCGTAIETGDSSWARVCIAGFPRTRDGRPIEGNLLFLSSMNDGAVSLARFGGKDAIPSDIVLLEESSLEKRISSGIPKRAALVFEGPDAPNHISFLSEGVNDAMIDLLSPLLPVAQTFSIPVLDFDRYQISRDSLQAAEAYHPLVIAYLKQEMKV